MKYFINGDEVSADTYYRDANDNVNCGIAFTEQSKNNNTELHIDYDEG